MKKYIALIGLLIFLNPVTVFAGNDMYVKAGAGFFNLEDSDVGLNYQGTDNHIGGVNFDGGFNLHAAIGKYFDNGLAVELEYGYNQTDADKFEGREFVSEGISFISYDDDLNYKTSINTLMVNGIYNLENSSSFTPYAGIGIGLGWVNIDSDYNDLSGTNFAFQLLAGIAIDLTDQIALTTGYRYLDAGEVTKDDSFTVYDRGTGALLGSGEGEYSTDLQSHNFEAAIKYSF